MMPVRFSWLGRAVCAAVVCVSLASAASADVFAEGTANEFNIDFVTIPGSAGDGYGGQSAGGVFTTSNIAHDYRIGTYEVTNDQWDKFKAALAPVPVAGSPGYAYDEAPSFEGANVPTNNVSWYEAAQFVNWLNTSTGHQAAYKFTGLQGSTGTYTGYTLDTWSPAEADNGTNLYRHKDAFYYLPTEDEWLKAGYWNGTSLQTYATKPGDTLHQGDGVSGTGWNYYDGEYATDPSGPWDVGSGSEELKGTYDIMGNVYEWMENPQSDTSFGTASARVVRGGSYDYFPFPIPFSDFLKSSGRIGVGTPTGEYTDRGFRVASEVPEPASIGLLAIGGLALLRRRRCGTAKLAVLFLAILPMLGLVSAASADSFGTGSNQFDIDFVTIDGSTNPTSGYGIVNNDYRMGTYEITNDQWNKFKAAYGTVTGTPSYAYDSDPHPYWTGANVPTNNVSWYEAAQFVNWLNTEAGHQPAYKFTGTQGQSDYTFGTWSAAEADNGTNLYRHKDAFYYLPTMDEWLKAGYWNGASLQTYATKPGDTLHQGDGVIGTGWNYYDYYGYANGYASNPGGPWDVGSGSEELNGTYDIMGNVWEWMESRLGYRIDADRGVRGGSYEYDGNYLAVWDRNLLDAPHFEINDIGFRVASEVPEPATMSLLAIGGLALIKRRRR